jgi:hypothetical protein
MTGPPEGGVMKLDATQIEAFEHDGYVLTDGFLSEKEITHIQDCYMDTVARLTREKTLENVQSGADPDEDFQVYQDRKSTRLNSSH